MARQKNRQEWAERVAYWENKMGPVGPGFPDPPATAGQIEAGEAPAPKFGGQLPTLFVPEGVGAQPQDSEPAAKPTHSSPITLKRKTSQGTEPQQDEFIPKVNQNTQSLEPKPLEALDSEYQPTTFASLTTSSVQGLPPSTGRRSALINLPSRGLFYDQTRIPVVNGAIRAYVLSGREELGFAGSSGDYLKVIDAILASCLNSDQIAAELISGDRLYSLLALRAHTYGADYGFDAKCPECAFKFMEEMNLLEDLEVEYADESWGPEPFSVQLPQSREVVQWRMMRGFDEVKIDEYVNNYYAKNSANKNPLGNPQEECRNALVITHINGEDTRTVEGFRKKIQWLRAMDAMDLAVLRTEINDKEPGAKMHKEVTCPKCTHTWNTPIRLRAEFFRPSVRSRRGR